MQVIREFPRPIREIENAWIPLSDGTRLAARIWMPTDAAQDPVPAILEYLPYRKNDGTAARDALTHPYFAGHGYASIRVDMRGSGDSDGLLLDEYLPQEQDDALEVLKWIAAQPWCTGNVGIIGISWGGFNGLQIAARRPPELKAIISLCSTDDRYRDDCHYMGGCVLGSDMLGWASRMLLHNAKPPDPRFVGEKWRDMWLNRMADTPPFIHAWLEHQRRDAFWKHGSVCEDYGAITCPVYAVGGWADAYTNAVPRLLAGLSGPKKGLIGPWAHRYPHIGLPGPAIGFLQECLRWWDYWLKGIETGIMNEPMVRAWIIENIPLTPTSEIWPGRWVAEPTWPPPSTQDRDYLLDHGALVDSPGPEMQLAYQGAQYAGLDSGVWCGHGAPGDLPGDQRGDDGLSLTFTSRPVDEPIDILGFPKVTLDIAADKPNALVAARLCDVSPTGSSTLVTWGLLNLTHRESDDFPTPLEPGKRYRVSFRLNAIGYALAPGHCWRLAISPTYWPHAWPSPEPVTLTVFTGNSSRLSLPVRTPQPVDEQLAPFEPPESAEPLQLEVLRGASYGRIVSHDAPAAHYTIVDRQDGGRQRLANGLVIESSATITFSIDDGDPLSAQVRCENTFQMGRGHWGTRIETVSTMTADAEFFHVANTVKAFEGDKPVFTKNWERDIRRDLV